MKKRLIIILSIMVLTIISIVVIIHIDRRNYNVVKDTTPSKEWFIEDLTNEFLEDDITIILLCKEENIIYMRVNANGYMYNINYNVTKTDLSLNYQWKIKKVHLTK